MHQTGMKAFTKEGSLKTNSSSTGTKYRDGKTGWSTYAFPLLSFAAGLLLAACLVFVNHVRADASRVFELRVYHALPGKMPALEARFRDKTSKLLAKHGLAVVGYWVSESTAVPESASAGSSDERFIWVVAYPSREEGQKNWKAMFADPEFQEIVKAEQAEKLVEKVDVTFMRATDFSAVK